MTSPVNRFYNAIENVHDMSQADLVGLFVYHLTTELGQSAASVAAVRTCFEESDLTPPARLTAYLSEGTTSKPQRYVKTADGYRLQRHYRETLSHKLGAERVVAQTSVELRRLENSLPSGPKKSFLGETIDCFEAGANRAAIVMCWILTVDHLFDHVLNHHLTAFNAALAKNPDKRVRVVTKRDDLSELQESKFIELLRAASIISNDVRKILEEKLGTRNSSAHPSGVSIARSKAIDFIEDLVVNVLAKYAA
ncbi:MAG: hypothetical protein JNJ73_00740 [Hyphomonadaceae bacterium]|nr:hypothetical protein [Hyphomonadaceae bacterium]